MKVSALREGAAMASPPARDAAAEELGPAGAEPGDLRAKPPVKPKPRALPTKPALPAKPTLLVPVGPRPPRGPLAELPSARKMNMLAGPQPYGGSKRPLPFAPRPAELPAGGEATQDPEKEEVGREDPTPPAPPAPPPTPPAWCSVSGGVRKAPAPFRPAAERCAAATVEEILARMEQPRRELPASPERIWGSRLTFNHDGSSRYGPRTCRVAMGPGEENTTLPRPWSQEGPAERREEQSRTLEDSTPSSDQAVNGDLASPASSEPPADSSAGGSSCEHLVPADLWQAAAVASAAACRWGPEAPAVEEAELGAPPAPAVQRPLPAPHGLPAFGGTWGPRGHSRGGEQLLRALGPEALPPGPPKHTFVREQDLEGDPLEELQWVPQHWVSPGPGQASEPSGCSSPGLPADVPGPAPSWPQQSCPHPPQLPDAKSPASDPTTLMSAHAALPDEDFGHPPSPGLPSEAVLGTPGPSSPASRKASECHSPEQLLAASTRPLAPGGESPDIAGALPPQEEAAAAGGDGQRATSLTQRRSTEGVLQPPSQERLAGSPAGLPRAQGGQAAQDRSFVECPCSLPQSCEWPVPARPPGLGVCRLDSPPPSPVPEASGAVEAAEVRRWAVASREEAAPPLSLPRESCPLRPQAPEALSPASDPESPQGQADPAGPVSWMRGAGPGGSPAAWDHGEGLPEPLPPALAPALLPAEEWCEDRREPAAGQACPLAEARRETALPVREAAQSQQQPASPGQPCVLFAGGPVPGQALPGEEKAVALVQAEATQAKVEAREPCGLSPEPTGPGSSSRWLDDLLASPPPSAGSARRGAGSESPGACPEGLLGWARKDLRSEFGIAADPPPSSLEPSSWSHSTSQEYGLGDKSPQGDQGLGDRDWTSTYRPGTREGCGGKWAASCGLGQDSTEVSHNQDPCEGSTSEGPIAPAWMLATPQEADAQQWALQHRDPPGTFSSRDAELQDQEFGKRDSLGACGRRDTGLEDWELGMRDALGSYPRQAVADEQACSFGRKDHVGGYSSQEAEEQDREFEKRETSRGPRSASRAVQQDPEFRTSAWVRDLGGDSDHGACDRGSSMSGLSSSFGLEEAQQWDEGSEKTAQSGEAGQPGERNSGGLLSPSLPSLQEDTPGQRDRGSWQGSDASPETQGPPRRLQVEAQGAGDAALEDGDEGLPGWAGELSLGVAPQPGLPFSPGCQGWAGDLCIQEVTERSSQFGVIGDDRVSGASPSLGGHVAEGRGVPTQGSMPVDWGDQLGLRNLDVSRCIDSGDPSEARAGIVGQVGWSGDLGGRDQDLAGPLDTGGSVEPRGVGVGQKDGWICDMGLRSMDLGGGRDRARESGVGQSDWSSAEASEFLKSRECEARQPEWTPDLGLREMAPGSSCSPQEPRELGVGQVAWGGDLGLRNLEVPGGLEAAAPRGCGVGQVDQAQAPPEASAGARVHGVGEVRPGSERSGQSARSWSLGLEARELGVGETSRPDTLDEDGFSTSCEIHPKAPPEDPKMETGDGSSPGQSLTRSPPSGSQGLPEKLLAAHDSREVATRASWEEEGGTAGTSPRLPSVEPLPARRPQPDGEASRTEEVDGTWGLAGAGRRAEELAATQDFSFIEDTEVLDSAMYRSRASLGRKRGHRAPAIRPGGTLGLAEGACSDAHLFQDSTEPRASRAPSSDEEVTEGPQSRRTRMSLSTKALKVNLFPGLSPSALKAKLRSRNRSAEEVEPADGKAGPKEAAVQRSTSCKVPGLGKPLALPPKPEKSSGSEGSSPSWLQALKMKKKKV
ncbi:182 kDa tankyrase-1-binding protein [Ctenodactylus gundi]